jgi:hypothetical protein
MKLGFGSTCAGPDSPWPGRDGDLVTADFTRERREILGRGHDLEWSERRRPCAKRGDHAAARTREKARMMNSFA